ncbi:MAG: peptide transporter [Crenarchaeota archaeon]|nr:peptide transporter [Thermoproteota archaeon]
MKARVLAALMLVALMLAPSLAPLAAAEEVKPVGQPVTKIVFKTVTEQTAGITAVGKGEADIFMWSQPLGNYKNIDPNIMENIALIPSASTFYDIALNPASNVYDSQKPGVIILKDKNISGVWLPGLVYPDADKELGTNWVDISQLSPEQLKKIEFNPWGCQLMRLAFQYLVDRTSIIDNILEGSANPMLTAITPTHGAYPWVQDIPENMGITAIADVQKAKELFQKAVEMLNKIYEPYGFQLYYKEEDGKKWLYLKYPDGTEKPVTVHFVIRVEDERLQIGRQIAKWIEDTFGIKVNRIERERSVVTPVIYGTNPIDTSDRLGGVMWSMYTEGWVSMTDDPAYYARYDSAFFYAPLRGYGPNHRVTSWWYLYDPKAYELGYKLYFGTYTPEQKEQLINDIRKMIEWGLNQSFRVFISQNLEYFPVNKNRVTFMVYGTTTGLWSIWGIRTARTVDGQLTILEYSSQGALFMSAWNPVLGFQDVYSEVIWSQVHDFGLYNHPVTGMPTPIRATYKVDIKEVEVPKDAIIYDPVEEKWITVEEAIAKNKTYIPGVSDLIKAGGKAATVVIFNYKFGPWHDGSPMNLADVLGTLAFDYEWAVNDTKVTGQPDPYYDPEIETAISGTLANIFGIKIINDTAIAIYTPYVDVDPALIAAAVNIWPYVPIHLLVAMEKAVVEDPGGKNYGWTDREATGEIAIDMLRDGQVIKEMAQQLKGAMPKYLEGLNIKCNWDARIDNLLAFIDKYGHAVVSNGPYKVVKYDPQANIIELQFCKTYPLGLGYIPEEVLKTTRNNYYINPEPLKTQTPTPTETQTATPTPTATQPQQTQTQTPQQTATETQTPAQTQTQTPTQQQTPTQTQQPQQTAQQPAQTPTQTQAGGFPTALVAGIVIIIIIAAAALMMRRKPAA